jgi:hypothetical protein
MNCINILHFEYASISIALVYQAAHDAVVNKKGDAAVLLVTLAFTYFNLGPTDLFASGKIAGTKDPPAIAGVANQR